LHSSETGFDSTEAKNFADSLSEFRIGLMEIFNCSLQNISGHSFHTTSCVLDRMLSIYILHNFSEEISWLCEITIGMVGFMSRHKSSYVIGGVTCRFVVTEGVASVVEGVGLVVYVETSVFVHSHRTVTVYVVDLGSVGAVDGNLVVVDSKTMPVGVRVGEESALQHFV